MNELEHLLSQREQLRKQLDTLGEFRPGHLSQHVRKCGDPSCHCAKPDGARHRSWQLTGKINGKARCRGIGESELSATRTHLARYQKFQHWVGQFIELNESICDLQMRSARAQKKTSSRRRGTSMRLRSPPKRSTRC